MEYVTIKLPKNIITEIDAFMEKTQSYTSRTDLIKNAVRDYFFKYDNGTRNYQPPESGEERGEHKHEQMAEKTSTQSNSSGLDNAQGKSHRANEKRVEDPAEEIKSRDGEDDPLS